MQTGDLAPGTVLGKCEVVEMLGRGGMGAVYRARHRALDIDVAVKVIAFGGALDHERQQMRERFVREARAAARIRHHNVVQVLDVDAESGLDYMVMELVRGQSAKALLKRSPLSPGEAARIVLDAARALAAAHESGIVHRDVKPENILITESGVVKVSDFGLAAWSGVDSGLTRTGQILGTPYYMAPEQVHATGQVDTRTDIYALGATLHHLVAGRVPFTGDSAIQVCMAHLNEPPPPLRSHRPECPAELEALVLRMMAKPPDERVQSMAEVIALLEPHAAAEPTRGGLTTSGRPYLGPASAADPDGTLVGGASRGTTKSQAAGRPLGAAPTPPERASTSSLSVQGTAAGFSAITPSPSGAQALAPPQAGSGPASAPPRPFPLTALAVGALAIVAAAWLLRDLVGGRAGSGGPGPAGAIAGAGGAGGAGGGASGAGSSGQPELGRGQASGAAPTSTHARNGAGVEGAEPPTPTPTPTPTTYRMPSAEGTAIAARMQEMLRQAIQAEARQEFSQAADLYRSIALIAQGNDDPAVQGSAIGALQAGVFAFERNGLYKDALAMCEQLERDFASSSLLRMHISKADAVARMARLRTLAASVEVRIEPLRYAVAWGAEHLAVADLQADRRADPVLLGSPLQFLPSQGVTLTLASALGGLDLEPFEAALALVDADRTGAVELLLQPKRARWPQEWYALVSLPRGDRQPALCRFLEAFERRTRPRERATRGAAGDLDGDGAPELVLWDDGWSFIEVRGGSPSFPAARALEVPLQGTVEALAIARGAGGGGRDACLCLLEVTHKSGATTYELASIALARERGGAEVSLVRKDMRDWPHLAVGDWSGDGIDDLITNLAGPDPGRRLEPLLADGKGGFHSPPVQQYLEVPPAVPYAAIADLDGDGRGDAILRRDWPEEPTSLLVMRSAGDGSFAPVTKASLIDTFVVQDLVGADVDGDGHLDVVYFSRLHSELGVVFGDGQGGFRRR